MEWGSQIRRIGDYALPIWLTPNTISPTWKTHKRGRGAFLNNKKLTAFNAANVVEIGDGAFRDAWRLKKSRFAPTVFGKVFGRQFFEDSYQIDFGGEIYYIPQSLTEVTVSRPQALMITLSPILFFASHKSFKRLRHRQIRIQKQFLPCRRGYPRKRGHNRGRRFRGLLRLGRNGY